MALAHSGGAEWVGATDDGSTKRVTFEYGDSVDALDTYILIMRDLRATFPDRPGL